MKDFNLRTWRTEDAKDLAQAADNPGIARNLRNTFPSPYRLEDAVWFINDCISREGRSRSTMPSRWMDGRLAESGYL